MSELSVINRQFTLAEARKRLDVSRAYVAGFVNVSVTMVSRWENFRATPNIGQKEALARALCIPLEELRWEPREDGESAPAPRAERGTTHKTERGRSYVVTDDGKVLW